MMILIQTARLIRGLVHERVGDLDAAVRCYGRGAREGVRICTENDGCFTEIDGFFTTNDEFCSRRLSGTGVSTQAISATSLNDAQGDL